MKPMVKILAVGLLAAGVGVMAGRMLAPKPDPIPTDPQGKLQYGNKLFANGKLALPPVDEMTRYQLQTEGQKPFAVVVSCADSRVPPELIFNQGLGDLFVVRTTGHVVSVESLASIEYAVGHLKTPLIVVLGHSHCAAVQATLSDKPLAGHLPQITAHIEPVVRRLRETHPHLKGDALLERVIREHVIHTIQVIRERSAIVRELHDEGKVQFAGGVYDLRTGVVEWLKLPEELGGEASTPTHTGQETH
ncbi:MAG: carbonic anhydrase [Fimbriimonadales bacterium]